MKKAIALLLAALLALSLAACATEKSGKNPPQTSGVKESREPGQATKESTPTEAQTESEQAQTETAPAKTEPPEDFAEVTVIDTDDCLLRITEIDAESLWGYTLKIYLENRTSDKTLMFATSDGAVNGVAWDPYFAAEVAPGKKGNQELFFLNEKLEALLPEFTDIELAFRVYDSDDLFADDLADETVHIYPLGEENASVYVREPQPTDTVLVDNDQFTVIVTGYEKGNGSVWGYAAELWIVNKTDMSLTFANDEVSVNGFMCDPFWAVSVAPGKSALSTMSWTDDSLEENGITEVQEIEMLFRVYDSENWSAGTIFEETVTLKP